MVQPKLPKPFQKKEDVYIVNFLDRNKFKLYNFVPQEEEVNKTSVSGFYDVESLEETGLFVKVPRGYELIDDSEDEDSNTLRVMKMNQMTTFHLSMREA